jgi:hypothetical protein
MGKMVESVRQRIAYTGTKKVGKERPLRGWKKADEVSQSVELVELHEKDD